MFLWFSSLYTFISNCNCLINWGSFIYSFFTRFIANIIPVFFSLYHRISLVHAHKHFTELSLAQLPPNLELGQTVNLLILRSWFLKPALRCLIPKTWDSTTIKLYSRHCHRQWSLLMLNSLKTWGLLTNHGSGDSARHVHFLDRWRNVIKLGCLKLESI